MTKKERKIIEMSLLLPEEAARREKRRMKETLNSPMLCDKQSSWEGKGGRREGRNGAV
jgi:hypothetical protein